MAVETTNSWSGPYVANGVSKSFPFSFTIADPSEVAVVLRDGIGNESLLDPTLYTVTPAPTGGTVVTASAVAAGYQVFILSDPSFQQEIAFENGSRWLADPVNEANDRSAIRDQVLKRQVDRALLLPLGEQGRALPTIDQRRNGFLAFDASGLPTVTDLSGVAAQLGLQYARDDFLATAGQTSFQPTFAYDPEQVGVFVNGQLISSLEYTGDGSGPIIFASGLNAGDTVSITMHVLGGSSQESAILTPEHFGALGDGVANDTIAFQKLSAFVQGQGGGTIMLRPGAVYLVGGQDFAGATGMGYAYNAWPVFVVSNLSGLRIIGNGATLQMVAGQHYGSFDPVTGLAAGSGSVSDRRASIGNLIDISSSRNISIENLTLDGALPSAVIGGSWNPPAIQLDAIGLRLFNVEQVHVDNVVCSNNGLDGIYLRGNRRTQYPTGSDNLLLTNVDCNLNGRQGMSWVGGHGLTAINCRFRNTSQGSAYNGNPAAGVDIEPNGSDWASQGLFLNCSFENNVGVGLLASSGNSRGLVVRDTEFWQGFVANGTTVLSTGGDAMWVTRSNLVVENCRIHGTMPNGPSDGSAIWRRCSFDNQVHPIYGQAGASGSRDQLVQGCPGTFEDCTFNASLARPFRTVFNNGATYRRCTFVTSAALTANFSAAEFAATDVLIDCTLSDNIAAPASGGHLYIVASGVTLKGTVMNNGPNVGWGARIVNNGFVGELTGSASLTNSLRFGTQTNPGAHYRAASAPTSGTYNTGDVVWNRTPTAGGKVGWVCTAGGTPGTFNAFGVIDA